MNQNLRMGLLLFGVIAGGYVIIKGRAPLWTKFGIGALLFAPPPDMIGL